MSFFKPLSEKYLQPVPILFLILKICPYYVAIPAKAGLCLHLRLHFRRKESIYYFFIHQTEFVAALNPRSYK